MSHPAEHAGDAASFVILFGIFFNVLPHATAILSFIWVCGRLFEMFTGIKPHETAPVRAVLGWVRKCLSG